MFHVNLPDCKLLGWLTGFPSDCTPGTVLLLGPLHLARPQEKLGITNRSYPQVEFYESNCSESCPIIMLSLFFHVVVGILFAHLSHSLAQVLWHVCYLSIEQYLLARHCKLPFWQRILRKASHDSTRPVVFEMLGGNIKNKQSWTMDIQSFQ